MPPTYARSASASHRTSKCEIQLSFMSFVHRRLCSRCATLKTSMNLRPLNCLTGKPSPFYFSSVTNIWSYDKMTLQTFLRNPFNFRYCNLSEYSFGQLRHTEDIESSSAQHVAISAVSNPALLCTPAKRASVPTPERRMKT